jgi:hypothetical protein
MTRLSATVLLLFLAPACVTVTELVPAAPAQRVEGARNLAVELVAGVELEVDGAPALGLRPGTEDLVSAVRLKVRNLSGVPLRLRYEDLRLLEADGSQRLALPPWRVDSRVFDEIDPAFVWDRFFVAEPYTPFVRGGPLLWSGPFSADPLYRESLFPRWPPALPTLEMLAYALPEGVLLPGGSVDGFVYFEGTPVQSQRVTFAFDLFNADTGALLGQAAVAFYVLPAGARLPS